MAGDAAAVRVHRQFRKERHQGARTADAGEEGSEGSGRDQGRPREEDPAGHQGFVSRYIIDFVVPRVSTCIFR